MINVSYHVYCNDNMRDWWGWSNFNAALNSILHPDDRSVHDRFCFPHTVRHRGKLIARMAHPMEQEMYDAG